MANTLGFLGVAGAKKGATWGSEVLVGALNGAPSPDRRRSGRPTWARS